MVAITVILAAVIGAFVLEIGNQGETAPATSFESDEQVRTFKGIGPKVTVPLCDGNGCETNLTQVDITHAGGDTIAITQLELKVDGNESVYGDPQGAETYDNSGFTGSADPTLVPQPNILESRGTNDPVSFESGESLEAVGFGGLKPEHINPDNLRASIEGKRLQWAIRDDGDWYCKESDTGIATSGSAVNWDEEPHNPTVLTYYAGLTGSCNDDLDAGNEVTLAWESASGGKSQTLFRYTVQQSNAN
jgi:FlaG/FlaF family flagellin (archaellin)